MTANPFLTALAPVLAAPITDVKAALTSIVATPTVENATAQGEKLALDAINPMAFQNVSIGALAQEALNIVTAIESHLTVATAAPSPAVIASTPSVSNA